MLTIDVLEGDLEGMTDELPKLFYLSKLNDGILTLLVMMQSEDLLISTLQ